MRCIAFAAFLFFPCALFAQGTANCTASIVRMADPPEGGFRYMATGTCDRIVGGMTVSLSGWPGLTWGGGVGFCSNTSTCTIMDVLTCAPPGTYDVIPRLVVNNDPTPIFGAPDPLVVSGSTQLSVRFAKSALPGHARAFIDYSIPQQIFAHQLQASVQGFPTVYSSGYLPLFGTWEVPADLPAGSRLNVVGTGMCSSDLGQQINTIIEIPASVDFGVTSASPEADRRILISNARSEYSYPHFQDIGKMDAAVPLSLRTSGSSNQYESGLKVYLRVTDPEDPASYMNLNGNKLAHAGDNEGAQAILEGPAITAVPDTTGVYQATSGANGIVEFALRLQAPFVAGDNYEIEASFSPTFPTGTSWKSGTLTAWKRVFIEKRRMLRNGLFLAQDAAAGDTFIVTRGNHWFGNLGTTDELSSSEKIVITHAPQISRVDLSSGWYYETHTILSVQDLGNGSYRVNLGTKQGKTVISEPLQHAYKVDTTDKSIGDGISKIDTLTLGPDDYFDVSPDLATGEAFLEAFTENIFLPDSTTPGAMVPVPFLEASLQTLLQNLAEKWSSVVNGTIAPNHQLLVIASDNSAGSSGDAAGVTIDQAGSGRTSSFVFRRAIATQLSGKNAVVNGDRWAMKTAAHEIAHQWQTNATIWQSVDPLTTKDHCPKTTKIFNDPASYCLLASFDPNASGSVAQRTNGLARFHLLPHPQGTGWHSEYLEIRRRPDPFVP
jgi:hypothetical protein